MTTRRAFIEANGADCRNWRWSWSFVNHEEKRVIFGAWDQHEVPEGQVILARSWRIHNGRVQPAFAESLEHIKLINSGFELWTFPLHREEQENGTSIIRGFTPQLTRKLLMADGERWLAVEPIE